VEVSIVSVLREVIVRGVLEAPWSQILAACAFLMVMGALLVVRAWLPPTFNGVDPEKYFSIHNKVLTKDESSSTNNFSNLDSQAIASVLPEDNGRLGREG
jgi:hypothetical protein